MYALAAHWIVARGAWKASERRCRATLTMVMSSTAMTEPTMTTPAVRRSWPADADADADADAEVGESVAIGGSAGVAGPSGPPGS